MGQQKKGNQQQKKKAEAQGRNFAKCTRYESCEHQIKVITRKLARILKSSGPEEAKKWAQKHVAMDILKKLINNKSEFGDQSKIARLASEAHDK